MNDDHVTLKRTLGNLKNRSEKRRTRGDEFARNALAGTNLLIGIVEQRIKDQQDKR